MAGQDRYRLQRVDPRSSGYDRPDRDWVCGNAARGEPCAKGPDSQGHCGAGPVCAPVERGGVWRCARAKNRGGACANGPTAEGACGCQEPPCTPQRSWRAKRRRLSLFVALLALGLLGLGLGGVWMERVVDPGPLASHHAAVAGENGSCAACHDAPMDGGLDGLMARALNLGDPKPPGNGKCLACHEAGDHPASPHGFGPEVLRAKWDGAVEWSKASGWSLDPGRYAEGAELDERLSCAGCHREHGAEDKDLTETANAQACNACHVWGEASFPDEHPPFQSFPAKRRTVINYDHDSHAKRYFMDFPENAKPDCLDCHVLAEDGGRMADKPVTEMCPVCHADDGPAMGPKGVVVFNPPRIDARTLHELGMGIGEWPMYADVTPSALTRMMLSGDPVADAALGRMQGLPTMTLEGADAETLAAAQDLAWATKGLLVDIYRDGPSAALSDKLSHVLGRQATDAEVNALTGGLPRGVLREAMDAWFPNVIAEVDRHRAGEEVATVLMIDGEPWTPEGPASDTAEEDATDAGMETGSILGEGSILGDEESILGDESILGLGEEEPILGGGILAGGEDAGDMDLEALLGGDGASEPEHGGETATSGGDWGRLGGWIVEGTTIQYIPRMVADGMIMDWIDLSGDKGFTREGHSPFRELAAPDAVGGCGKCHGFEGTPETGMALEWHPTPPWAPDEGTTVFHHEPHVTGMAEEGNALCETCHRPAENSEAYLASFKQGNPLDFAPNFKQMATKQCADCHVEDTPLGACTTCHVYHPGGLDPAKMVPRSDSPSH